MKKKLIVLIALAIASTVVLSSCNEAETVKNNLQLDADQFNIKRRMTFINLRTGTMLYMAEGRFSVQSTYTNSYQGQQELGLIFEIADNQYKMDYFGLGDAVTYVIEQLETDKTDPWHWEIVWYVPAPSNTVAH